MNNTLVKNWNAHVSPGDTVYHLGDFAMGCKDNLNIRSLLNGKIILIRGNHDRSDTVMKDAGFDEIYNSLLLELNGLRLYLAHVPMHIGDPHPDRHIGGTKIPSELLIPPPEDYDYFLCGHVHNEWARIGNTINVGVDVSDYYPLTLSEVLE